MPFSQLSVTETPMLAHWLYRHAEAVLVPSLAERASFPTLD